MAETTIFDRKSFMRQTSEKGILWILSKNQCTHVCWTRRGTLSVHWHHGTSQCAEWLPGHALCAMHTLSSGSTWSQSHWTDGNNLSCLILVKKVKLYNITHIMWPFSTHVDSLEYFEQQKIQGRTVQKSQDTNIHTTHSLILGYHFK